MDVRNYLPDPGGDGLRRYGANVSTNFDGDPEDPARCAWTVNAFGPYHNPARQCARKRGHGPDGILCGPHARDHEKYFGKDAG